MFFVGADHWSSDCFLADVQCTPLLRGGSICKERQPENSWVGNLDFDDDGDPIGHYELDFEDNNTYETELWWRIEDKWDCRYYVYIDLLVLEVQ